MQPAQPLAQPLVFCLHLTKELKPEGKFADNLKGKFTDLVDGVKEKFSSIKSDAEDVAEKGYSAYNRSKTEAKSF